MNSLSRNVIKVSLGFFSGTALLAFIHPFPIILISIIQMFFFTVFYTLVDKLLDVVETSRLARKDLPQPN